MKTSNDLITDFYLKQREFGYLETLNLSRTIDENGYTEYYLNILLCKYPIHEGNQKLLLTFFEVKNLRVGNLEGIFKLFLDISELSTNKIEGAIYRVKEAQTDLLSFYCKTFDFKLIVARKPDEKKPTLKIG